MVAVLLGALAVGMVLGTLQSLAVGLRIGSWDGGTGCLWGLAIGLVSSISGLWVGWWSCAVAAVLSLVAWLATIRRVIADVPSVASEAPTGTDSGE